MQVDLDRVDPEPGLGKDEFIRSLIRALSGILENTVGVQEASAHVNHVGLVIGRALNRDYRAAFATDRLDTDHIAQALVHLKQRIGGGFAIERVDETGITLVNTAFPFGDKVIGRPSLCRMTAQVFGHIAAENTGYARVSIQAAIARGDARCRVAITFLKPQEEPHPNKTNVFGAAR